MKTFLHSQSIFKNALTFLVFLFLGSASNAQTYTSIANGNWNNPSTWNGGQIPPSGTIPLTVVININHKVNYNNSYLENYGIIKIVNTTGLNPELVIPTNVTFNNYVTGKLFIKDGLYTQNRFVGGGNSGTPQYGSFINVGGKVEIFNSIVEVAQDWQNNLGTSSFKNGSLTIGQNYQTSSVVAFDTLSGVSLSLGWHGNGDFKINNSFNNFQNVRVQLAGTSGNFKVNGNATVSGDIDYITFKNNINNIVANGDIQFSNSVSVNGSLNLDAYCATSVAKYDPKGKVSGTQTLNCSLNYFPANYIIASTAVLTNGLQFSNPTLISGTALQVGAVYSFKTIAPGIDATLKIDSLINGAQISNIDDNGASVGYASAFQPVIKSGNIIGRSYAVFTFNFYQANSNSLMPLQIVKVSALDLDGGATLKEFADINMGAGASAIYMSTTSDISINAIGTGIFRGQNVSGIERTGIDTTAFANMLTATNQNISSFSINYGTVTNVATNTARQFSLYMKGFTYPNQTTMPVKYLSFDAVAVDKSVLLKWITEEEINNNHFEVERSFDGNTFSIVGIVLDGNVTGTRKNYQIRDNAAELQSKTVVYYRLKQVDNNGKITYTNTLVVKLQAKAGMVVQTTPNPFVENITVSFSSTESGSAEINIISVTGQKIFTKQSTVSKGYNSLQLSGLGQLAPGMYITQLTMNGVVTGTQKIIKN